MKHLHRPAYGLPVVLVAALLSGLPALPVQAAPVPLPKAHAVPSVPGHDRSSASRPSDPTAADDVTATDPVTWPAAGVAEVALPAATRAATPTTAAPPAGWVRVPGLPVDVAASAVAGSGARAADVAPTRVQVRVLDRTAATASGHPFMLRVAGAGPVRLRVDYSGFRSAYGADWPARLRLVQLPDCALTTPGASGCAQRDLASVDDPAAATVAAQVDAVPAGTVVALDSAPSSDGGDYTATGLLASSTWAGGSGSGDFTWSYPMRVPPSLGGPEPQVSLAYSAQSSDGRTAASNNQPSWIGEGFEFGAGAITRSYKACLDDGQTSSGDLCWGTDNATLAMSGRGGELIQASTSPDVWRLVHDDGTRVERLTGATNGDDNGEYWKVTTTDGTQYFFGLNRLPGWASGNPVTGSAWTVPVFGNNAGEPCNRSTFAASWCLQAYEWNLDYVLDTHGNSMSYWYSQETNNYARNRTDTTVSGYTRGGNLARIDYGTRQDGGVDSDLTGTAPQRVSFATQDRCVVPGATCVSSNPGNWPDVPWDEQCTSTSNCAGKYSPTFFTQKMLSTVTTQVANGTGYRDVERWTLSHVFKDPGDAHPKILWLNALSHTGLVGTSTAMPDITFGAVAMNNRVDTAASKAPIVRYRIASIANESGGITSVSYLPAECAVGSNMPASPDSNTKRCFPVYWVPYGQTAPVFDWFHKYVVHQVTEADNTGGAPFATVTYSYLDAPAWHYDETEMVPASHKSWGQWRGYSRVRTTIGANGTPQSQSDTVFFRGMNGDKLSSGTRAVNIAADPDFGGAAVDDQPWRLGQTRETVSYNGTGDTATVVTKALLDPWEQGPTATRTRNGVTVQAYASGVKASTTKTALDGARGWRTTKTTNTYDYQAGTPNAVGRLVMVDNTGDTSSTADDQCTRYTYATNPGAWLLSLVAEVETVGVNCATAPNRATDVLSDVRTWYDGATAFGTSVTKGDVTRTEQLADWNGGQPIYAQVSRAGYDAYGRVVDTYDALDHRTSTKYSPASAPVTSTTVTNPAGWTATTTFEPAWGKATSLVDLNGHRSDLAYDGLGQLTGVWLPGRDRATQTASAAYTYVQRSTGGPTAVGTATLNTDGSGYRTSWTIYDGLLRPRQTQAPAPGGGRIVTDTEYDSRGLVFKQNQPYYNAGAPGSQLFVPNGDLPQCGNTAIPGCTLTTYDGAGRATASIFNRDGVEAWRTSTYDGGDHTTVTMPAGSPATTTWTDTRGQTTALWQYHGSSPTGTHDTTSYRYTRAGQLSGVTDSVGNSWQYGYDQRGRKTTEADPDKGHSSFSYDDAGHLLTSTDSRGITLTYTYDAMGRKTQEWQGSPSAGTKLADWTYDTLAKGQLTSANRYANGRTYTVATTGYDAAYRPTGAVVTLPAAEGTVLGTSWTTTMTYNADGSLATTTLPAAGSLPAETVHYGYNAVGMPTTLSGLTTYVTGTSYDSLGRTGTVTESDGGGKTLTQVYNYEDGSNRLLEHGVLDNAGQAVFQDATYTYDAAGNVLSIKDLTNRYGAGPDDNQCFGYDYLRRLTQAWTPANGDCTAAPSTSTLGGPAPYWQSWSYDLSGDRLSQTDHATSGNTTSTAALPAAGSAQPHAPKTVTAVGPAGTTTSTYAYDSTGNTTARPGQTLTWDAEGRMAGVTDNSGTTSYVYDPAGNRLVQHDPSGTTLYLGGEEIRVSGAAVAAERFYGSAAVRTTDGGLVWTTTDDHGTNDLTFAAATLAKTQRRATPFGGPRGSAPTWPTDKGFVGGTTDAGGSLVGIGAREYDPNLGRFLSVDPLFTLADPQSWNGYAYADNTPVTASDPTGLRICLDSCGGADDKYVLDVAVAKRHGSSAKPMGRCPRQMSSDDCNHWGSPVSRVQRSAHFKNGTQLTIYTDGSVVINGYVLPEGHPDPYLLAEKTDEVTPKVKAAQGDKSDFFVAIQEVGVACYEMRGCSSDFYQKVDLDLEAVRTHTLLPSYIGTDENYHGLPDNGNDPVIVGLQKQENDATGLDRRNDQQQMAAAGIHTTSAGYIPPIGSAYNPMVAGCMNEWFISFVGGAGWSWYRLGIKRAALADVAMEFPAATAVVGTISCAVGVYFAAQDNKEWNNAVNARGY
jgi:RHS repeat-associated protein